MGVDLDLGKAGIVGQGSTSNAQNRVSASLSPCFKVKVKGQGQGSTIWGATVDIRGSALPSAAKSNRSHYQSSGVRVCVCNQWAYAGNCADAVDRLLIFKLGKGGKTHYPGPVVTPPHVDIGRFCRPPRRDIRTILGPPRCIFSRAPETPPPTKFSKGNLYY